VSLLANLTSAGHLIEALFHFNQAFDMGLRYASKVHVARTLFDGLNKLQTEWLMSQAGQQLGEVKAFQTMISLGLSLEAKDALLRSDQVQSLVALNPMIMNHDVLRRRGYRPDVAIEPTLANHATEVHRKLENAYRDLHENREEVPKRVLKRVAELLYIVRSNIAHGEKTPCGPDLNKRERDEQVCACIVPLQELLLDMLLGQPSKRLISYGTLAPGQPNHSLVSDLKGEWEECVIRGTMNQKGELLRFLWNPTGPEQTASLFTSNDLPSNWHRIDQFEGAEYRRQLVLAKTQDGISVGYAYVTA